MVIDKLDGSLVIRNEHHDEDHNDDLLHDDLLHDDLLRDYKIHDEHRISFPSFNIYLIYIYYSFDSVH